MVVLGWGADALGVVLGMARMQATAWLTSVADLGFLVGLIGLLPGLPGGRFWGLCWARCWGRALGNCPRLLPPPL
jgi:hypothetical protein